VKARTLHTVPQHFKPACNKRKHDPCLNELFTLEWCLLYPNPSFWCSISQSSSTWPFIGSGFPYSSESQYKWFVPV
jgi:hypothetical protein